MKFNQRLSKIMDAVTQFKPRQIVCLDYLNHHLYSEVVQVINSRNLCWVRPLMLATLPEQEELNHILLNVQRLIDVRFTSDLLYPSSLFRPALDTEVISLISQLDTPDFPSNIQIAGQQLRQFVFQVWQANSEIFS